MFESCSYRFLFLISCPVALVSTFWSGHRGRGCLAAMACHHSPVKRCNTSLGISTAGSVNRTSGLAVADVLEATSQRDYQPHEQEVSVAGLACQSGSISCCNDKMARDSIPVLKGRHAEQTLRQFNTSSRNDTGIAGGLCMAPAIQSSKMRSWVDRKLLARQTRWLHWGIAGDLQVSQILERRWMGSCLKRIMLRRQDTVFS